MNSRGLLLAKLQECFADLRVRNSSYSLRAFARKLGINSGALSTILNGKRQVSKKMALRLADRLGLDPAEMSQIENSFLISGKILPAAMILSADQHKIIAEWYHFAILNLTHTKGFKNDPKWIGVRLGISPNQARDAVERLLRLELLILDGKSIKRNHQRYQTTDGTPNAALRKAHATNLELALRSLERDPIELRDFSSITFPCDPQNIEAARKIVRQCQEQVVALMSSKPNTQVYKMCAQIFTLSQGE